MLEVQTVVPYGISETSPVVVQRVWGTVGLRYITHHHPEYEFILVHRGGGVYFIHDRQQPFGANTLMLFHPDDVHGLFVSEGKYFGKTRISFKSELLHGRPCLVRLIEELPNTACLTERETICVDLACRNIQREVSDGDEFWRQIVLVELEKITCIAKRASSRKCVQQPTHRAVSAILAHIEQHFAEELSLARLAHAVRLSPNYLCSLFASSTGTSVKQYILQRRIAEATRLLREFPDLKVSDIALSVGFSRFADFNRNFCKITGLTPTSYRKISYPNTR